MQTLSDFQFIELNGMTIADPQRAYVILWWHLMGQRASAKAARLRLTDYFTGSAKKGTARPKKKWCDADPRCMPLVPTLAVD